MSTTTPQDILASTLANFHGLKALKNSGGGLAPGEETNRMFGGLVAAARAPLPLAKAETVLAELHANIDIGDLHTLCAEGEFALEQHWAHRIRDAANPKKELKAFPYWSNYLKLAKLEVAALRKAAPDAKKVLFVGAGPLPLTAYIFAAHYGLDVTNLEVEESAACCALEWMEPILGAGHIPCHHMDVMDFTGFADYDVIVLAALVGLNQAEKQRIVAHLHTHMSPEQLLMVRSVRGLRKLLYPVVKGSDLAGFDVVREVHPRGEVVNSVVLARKAGRVF
jgi:nicotianamine synthase